MHFLVFYQSYRTYTFGIICKGLTKNSMNSRYLAFWCVSSLYFLKKSKKNKTLPSVPFYAHCTQKLIPSHNHRLGGGGAANLRPLTLEGDASKTSGIFINYIHLKAFYTWSRSNNICNILKLLE